MQSKFPYNWKNSTNRHLAIINLFQLATHLEKPTSSNRHHTMERIFFFLNDSYSFKNGWGWGQKRQGLEVSVKNGWGWGRKRQGLEVSVRNGWAQKETGSRSKCQKRMGMGTKKTGSRSKCHKRMGTKKNRVKK